MDPIKEAFSKIKSDIISIKEEVFQLKNQLKNIQANQQINTNQQTDIQTNNQTEITQKTTKEPLYPQNTNISIGNNGVPTHTPTHTQTIKPTQNTTNLDFKEVNNILSSLDNIKKEIRLKFKRLTTQEMHIFTILYILDEQKYPEITYKTLANQINISESSIREYISKLIKKGIPINKTKQNNKLIILSISQDLKNIATLQTIQKLREL